MNRTDLQKLAGERVADAEILLANGRFSAAYYLSGYAVECALKACVAKLTKAEDFYDKDLAKKIFTHKPGSLADAARLSGIIKQLSEADDLFAANWVIVNSWDEGSRYESHSQQEARELLDAVADPDHGVLACIKLHW
jgi:HEPN domain-containing protein